MTGSLVVLEIEVEARVFLEHMLDVRERNSRATLSFALIAIIGVCHRAGILVVFVEGLAQEMVEAKTKDDHLERISLLSAGLALGVEHVAAVVGLLAAREIGPRTALARSWRSSDASFRRLSPQMMGSIPTPSVGGF